MKNWLDDVEGFDWADFHASAVRSQNVLRELAADKTLVEHLLKRTLQDNRLFAMCERHALDDKIVIYDALEERGFRIRFRLATQSQYERAHTHRFTFSTLVLRGMHYQNWYESTASKEDEMSLDNIRLVCLRDEGPGSAFTIHHSAIHSTTTTPGAIGLMMRGPSEKARSVIVRRSDGEKWWRYGEQEESAERRKEVAMDVDTYRQWMDVLKAQHVI